MPTNKFNENDTYTTSNKLDEIYETKEEANEKSNVLQRALRNILNAMNSSHNTMVEWQSKATVIGMMVSAIMIISMITSIILTNIYTNKMLESLEKMNNDLAAISEYAQTIQAQLDTMSDDSYTKIAESKEIEKEINEVREEIESDPMPEITEPVVSVEYNYTDIAQRSGFTAEQFNEIISKAFADMGKSDSMMTDIGAGLYTAEQEYNVNGLYLLGIASLETGWGTSGLATKANNIYGLIGMSFDSVDDCSEYMGKLIRNSYIDKGYDTLDKIQTKYCPNGGPNWVGNVKWCTNKYITAAIELYSGNN